MAHGRWSEVEARGVLEAWRRSGLPLERFAKQRGIVSQRLRWWRAKFNRAERALAAPPTPALLPVRVSAETTRRGEPVTVLRDPSTTPGCARVEGVLAVGLGAVSAE